MTSHSSEQVVEHLFRSEYGKLVALLTHMFGAAHIQLAEDVVQDTLISAMSHWSNAGTPENPTGWLVQVAKRKAINALKRANKVQTPDATENAEIANTQEAETVYLESEIEDSQLRMIFTCCHPSLNVSSQIALTLKTLCGFGVGEVAKALLTSESTINKRLYRAKTTIRDSNLPFNIPQGEALNSRLEAVCITLYLLFNEGYNSTSSETHIRKDLCLEAMRLTKLLVDRFKEHKMLPALLSLMCFHAARFGARIDHKGGIILFEDQDRTSWNRDLMNEGMQYLLQSKGASSLSAYHIEAAIAAEHCLAPSFEETNWASIYENYQLLEKLKPNPVIRLNLAIIESRLKGIETSLKLLSELEVHPSLKNYHLLPATQGMFELELGSYTEALGYLQKALKLKPSARETEVLMTKIVECEKWLSAHKE